MDTGWYIPPTINHGESVRAAVVDQSLRGNMQMVLHEVAHKSLDESLASSTTPRNDAELHFEVGANELWYIDTWMRFYGAVALSGNIRFQFAGPADCFISMNTCGLDDGLAFVAVWMKGTGQTGLSGAINYGVDTSSGVRYNQNFRGLLWTVSPGTFYNRWAQVTSSANAITVTANSNIRALRIGTSPGLPG